MHFFLSVPLDSETGVYALSYEITGSGLFSCEDDRTIKMWKQDDRATPETHPSKVKPPNDKWKFWGYQLFIVSFPSNLQRLAENKHNCTHLASTHTYTQKKKKIYFLPETNTKLFTQFVKHLRKTFKSANKDDSTEKPTINKEIREQTKFNYFSTCKK